MGVVAVLGVLLAAGCSSTPPMSLSKDQATVDVDQSAVARDQISLQPYTHSSTSQAISCAVSSKRCSAADSKSEAKLKTDEFKLQVARDQLKKDESAN